jgi:saccharopine dehydrogenase-like NADP-dependent oxidoreductase
MVHIPKSQSNGSNTPPIEGSGSILKHTQKETHMTKTPYEIRLEVLKMAQDQANQKFYKQWETAAMQSQITESTQFLTEVPEFPTADQILAEAHKLKGFVDNG